MFEMPSGHRKWDHLPQRSLSCLTYIQYCKKACQTSHWSIHKHDCKSSLAQQNWKPKWVEEHREPAFLVDNGAPTYMGFGNRKYLFGNMPSFDVIKLADNESDSFDQDLEILFAGT